MYKLSSIEKKNCFYSTVFLIFIFLFNKFAFCFTIETKIYYSRYKHLDIENDNNKENIFKINLRANPSKKSNSFLQIGNHKELYHASFAISSGIKQYLHFHSSVNNIIIKFIF
jgi:hypothetical protein